MSSQELTFEFCLIFSPSSEKPTCLTFLLLKTQYLTFKHWDYVTETGSIYTCMRNGMPVDDRMHQR